jgi:dolichol-phosphate mannosyltransferase
MKYTAYCLRFKIKEVSIVFVNRMLGTSKMNSGIFAEGVFGVLTMRFRQLFGGIKKKKKAF